MKLKSITLNGFKSFDNSGHAIQFGDVTVLIGANGAGKSNLVSFFKMVGFMMTKALQQYIGEQGFASSLLYYGPKKTPRLTAKLEFENEQFYDAYEFSLAYAAQDTMIITEEIISYHDKKFAQGKQFTLPPGLKESGLKLDNAEQRERPVKMIHALLCNCRVYQFHDTSSSSKIRNGGYINQGDFLYSDGGNLAAFLYGLKENRSNRIYYNKIVRHIKQVFPQFKDFNLNPSARNNNFIMLDWCEHSHNEYKFGPHQISDGSLRFMALAALLLQPPKNLPAVIILDEPELGLHPSAIIELAGMVKTASQHTQIVLATQSPSLLDEFNPGQVTIIERDPISQTSQFKKYSEEELKDWLKDFTLSEIWDKNILGGKPLKNTYD
ncbi:MAG: AAA family ATPase [Bacteroidia bacterium]|nr:AAA family ATPase [Bacteroidia bacterium]